MGDGQFKTPNIDQLTADGVLCKNGYATTAVCATSRASLLTGRYSTRFGFEFTPTSKGFGKLIADMNQGSDPPTDRKMDGTNMLPYLTGAKADVPSRPLFTIKWHFFPSDTGRLEITLG